MLRRFDTGWDDETREAVVRWFQRTQDEAWKGGNSFAGNYNTTYTRQAWFADNLGSGDVGSRLAQLDPTTGCDMSASRSSSLS